MQTSRSINIMALKNRGGSKYSYTNARNISEISDVYEKLEKQLAVRRT